MPKLAREGLDAARLALLARRVGRANAAIEAATDRAEAKLTVKSSTSGAAAYDAAAYAGLAGEIGLRLLGRAIDRLGNEGPVELAKLEALKQALDRAQISHAPFRRSLAGAIVTLKEQQIVIEAAPRRRGKALTKGRRGKTTRAKTR
jgi:tRNA(Ile)-lysidine synthase